MEENYAIKPEDLVASAVCQMGAECAYRWANKRLTFSEGELRSIVDRAGALARLATDNEALFTAYIAIGRAAADLLEVQVKHGGCDPNAADPRVAPMAPPTPALTPERLAELRAMAAEDVPGVQREMDPERARLRAEGEAEMKKALEALEARGARVTAHGDNTVVESSPIARLEEDPPHPCPGA